jgi:hypothetical protein
MLPLLSLLLAFPPKISASPVPGSGATDSACAQIKGASTPDPSGTSFGRVPAQLAWDCLQSVPINNTNALDLIGSIRPYLAFQTTGKFLARPTPEYTQKVQAPLDIFEGLDKIEAKIKSNQYKGEYEVRLAHCPKFGVFDLIWLYSSDLSCIRCFNQPMTATSAIFQTVLLASFSGVGQLQS